MVSDLAVDLPLPVTSMDWVALVPALSKPWPESAAFIDLRFWQGQAEVGSICTGERPSIRDYAKRWGWSRRRAAAYVYDFRDMP